jgi:CSLREA domain-containing protein
MPRTRALLLVALFPAISVPLRGADFIVTRYDDPNPGSCAAADCSLREAVQAAGLDVNTSDRIFLSAGLYQLSRPGTDDTGVNGDLDLKGSVEILGPGPTMTTVDGGGLDRIFHAQTVLDDRVVRLRGLTLTHGDDGEAVAANGQDLYVEECEFHDNNADSADDYAIRTLIGTAATISGTTIHGEAGGGILVTQGTAFIYNSTFTTSAGHHIAATSDAAVYCNHCTLVGDGAVSQEVLVTGGAVLQLANSVLSNIACSITTNGAIDSFGGNLESPGATCELDLASDQDGLLAIGVLPLAMNGGATPTHELSPGSFAVNAANDTFCQTEDQRGAVRPDANCDSGAVEINLPKPPTPIFQDGFLQGDEEAWSDVVETVI